MDSTLISFRINRTRCHCDYSEGKYCSGISNKIKTIVTNDLILLDLDDRITRYIEICILFDSLFSISRPPCGEFIAES